MGKSLAKRRELDPSRRPWEKQPWETLKAFEAFAIFRDLGLTATLSKAVEAYMEGTPGRNPVTVRASFGKWSAENLWQSRAEAYVLHFDERMREQREGRIARQNRRYETGAATIAGRLLKRLSLDEFDGVLQPVDFNELDAEGVARVLKIVQAIERLATGQPTELVRGAFAVSTRDVERICGELVQGLMQFVPEDRQPLAAQWVVAYAQGGSGGQLAA